MRNRHFGLQSRSRVADDHIRRARRFILAGAAVAFGLAFVWIGFWVFIAVRFSDPVSVGRYAGEIARGYQQATERP